MEKQKTCLLIWPPLAVTSILPLSIPFLKGYLKKKQAGEIKVLDLNRRYLQHSSLTWLTLTIFLNLLTKLFGGNPAGKRFILAGFDMVAGSIAKRKRRSIAWSLDSIINAACSNFYYKENNKIYKILKHAIDDKEISLIGISAVYPEQLLFALIIARVVKEKFNKNLPVVIGGAQVTKHINQLNNKLAIKQYVDFFIPCDGEEPLLNLLDGLKEPKQNFLLKPENFPLPDFSGFDLNTYSSWIPLLASKGCFWSRCTFCTYTGSTGNGYFINTPGQTSATIKKLKKTCNASRFLFVDDALPPQFMRSLAENLIKEKIAIKWSSSIILNQAFADKEFCALLKQSGLESVLIGLESASSRILRLMRKQHAEISKAEISGIFFALKTSGIKVRATVLFGFPTETRQEARETLDFLAGNRKSIHKVWAQAFSLEEGTYIFNHPEEFGITKINYADKNSGERIGFRYESNQGMSSKERDKFLNNLLFKTFYLKSKL